MLTDAQLATLRSSFTAVSRSGDDLAEVFFARVLAAHPPLRAILPRNTAERDRDLLAWLGTVVKNLHRVESIAFLLEDAGQRAQRAGLQPLHFGLARDALVISMRQILSAPGAGATPASWTAELESLWTEALNVVTSVMIRGAGRARSRAA